MGSGTLRCLIADPDGEYPVALQEGLSNHRFDVTVVHTAEECHAALGETAPHLAFIDLRILEQDFSVLHQPQLEDCETLIMGNEDCPETVHRAIRAGASYFFTKTRLRYLCQRPDRRCYCGASPGERKRAAAPSSAGTVRPAEGKQPVNVSAVSHIAQGRDR